MPVDSEVIILKQNKKWLQSEIVAYRVPGQGSCHNSSGTRCGLMLAVDGGALDSGPFRCDTDVELLCMHGQKTMRCVCTAATLLPPASSLNVRMLPTPVTVPLEVTGLQSLFKC